MGIGSDQMRKHLVEHFSAYFFVCLQTNVCKPFLIIIIVDLCATIVCNKAVLLVLSCSRPDVPTLFALLRIQNCFIRAAQLERRLLDWRQLTGDRC